MKFQTANGFYVPRQYFGHTYAKKFFVAYLKFKFKWDFSILYRNNRYNVASFFQRALTCGLVELLSKDMQLIKGSRFLPSMYSNHVAFPTTQLPIPKWETNSVSRAANPASVGFMDSHFILGCYLEICLLQAEEENNFMSWHHFKLPQIFASTLCCLSDLTLVIKGSPVSFRGIILH